MALTNAEKQARWRTAHADRRRTLARITTLLMRRRHAEGRTDEITVGWYTTKVDAYFFKLAFLICDALETDKEIRQLKNALAYCLDRRRAAREAECNLRKTWLKEHPRMTAHDFRRLRDTEVAQWWEARIFANREQREPWHGRERAIMWALDG